MLQIKIAVIRHLTSLFVLLPASGWLLRLSSLQHLQSVYRHCDAARRVRSEGCQLHGTRGTVRKAFPHIRPPSACIDACFACSDLISVYFRVGCVKVPSLLHRDDRATALRFVTDQSTSAQHVERVVSDAPGYRHLKLRAQGSTQ